MQIALLLQAATEAGAGRNAVKLRRERTAGDNYRTLTRSALVLPVTCPRGAFMA
jgi:hypothetical protein